MRFWPRWEQRKDDLNEELEAHLRIAIEELIARGESPEEARAAALREMGNPLLVADVTRSAWGWQWLERIAQDIRYGLRGIGRAPAYSLIVILTLAVGIGANTAIFSTIYTVLLKPLPFPNGERMTILGESTAKANGVSVTWINFDHWRKENHSFEAMAGYETIDMTLTGRGQAVLTHGAMVTNEFFPLTGVRPIMGRLLTANDDEPQSPAVAVVTRAFWTRVLGADPAIVGKPLMLNGSAYTIVGVLSREPGFFLRQTDYYIPFHPSPKQLANRNAHGSLQALALLKPGVTLAQARTDINTIMERLAKGDPGSEDDHRVYAEFVTEERTGNVRHLFALLMGAVGLVLILACANIASLLLIRMTQRAREIAIRSAIGAGRARLAVQLLTETLLITLIGGALGVVLAGLGLRLLKELGPRDIPRLMEASLDVPVLVFSAALTLVVGLACSLVPVFGARKVNLAAVLKENTAGAGSGKVGHAVRGGLVVAEIAAALVLLFTSSLLLRSLLIAENANPGFQPEHVLALELQLPGGRYKTDAAAQNFYTRLEIALRALPGVQSVGAVNSPPGGGDRGDYWYSIVEKPTPRREDVPLTLFNSADSSYFGTMGIPLLAGRGISEQDRAGGPQIAVINETLARTWWKDARTALGQHIKMGGPYMDGPTLEIVGVVGDTPQFGLAACWGASRWVSNMVFGITAHDPAALILAILGTLAMVMLAIAIPLWRATQVDPMKTLHEI